jgi:hypothetical protein
MTFRNKQKLQHRKGNLFFCASIFVFYMIQYFSNWKMLRIWNIDVNQHFSDLQLTWHQLVCGFRRNPGEEFECGKLDSDYIYGHILTPLANLRILDTHKNLFATISVIAALAAILYLVFHFLAIGNHTTLVFLLLMISPPIQLLVQRGNLDLHLTALLLVSFYLIHKGKRWSGFFLACLVALIKLYAVPIVIILCIVGVIEKIRYWYLQVIVAISVLMICLYDYGSIRTSIPSPNWGSFGFKPTTYWISYVTQKGSFLSGVIVVAFIMLLMFAFGKFQTAVLPTSKNSYQVVTVVALLPIFLSTYFLVSSFDYRLIILNLLGVAIASGMTKPQQRLFLVICLASLVSINYFSFNANGFFQASGDLLVSAWVGYFFCLAIIQLKQFQSAIRGDFH